MLINFDYDGVIADSLDQLLDLSVKAQQSLGFGRAPKRDDFRTIENLTFYDLGKLIGLPDELASVYENEIFKLEKERYDVKLFPDIVPVLIELAQKNTLVVITSNQSSVVSNTLKKFGLKNSIVKIFGGDDGTTKSERIEKSCIEFQCDPHYVFMVGDAISDVRQGKLAGVKTVAVTWGFQEREVLEREAPDFVIDKPQELLTIVV